MCDACVMHTCTGLVGPKTVKVKKVLVFQAFLKVSKGPGGAKECKEGAEKYHTLEPLWAYSDDFASLSDYFGIIVESLWVYAGRFSENLYFSNRF